MFDLQKKAMVVLPAFNAVNTIKKKLRNSFCWHQWCNIIKRYN